MVPMSQQSVRLHARSALDKRQPGMSSANGRPCYAQYLVVHGRAGLPRIAVMPRLLAMPMTPATARESTSFPSSGSPETHLTSPSRSLAQGQEASVERFGRDVSANAFVKEARRSDKKKALRIHDARPPETTELMSPQRHTHKPDRANKHTNTNDTATHTRTLSSSIVFRGMGTPWIRVFRRRHNPSTSKT